MFRLRWTIEDQPRSKNGQPPHRTTGVARANSSHPRPVPLTRSCKGWEGIRSEIMIARSGSVSTSADPEASGHADQFGVGRIVVCRCEGFERHAADGTASRLVADDLRVHRAGVFASRNRRWRRWKLIAACAAECRRTSQGWLRIFSDRIGRRSTTSCRSVRLTTSPSRRQLSCRRLDRWKELQQPGLLRGCDEYPWLWFDDIFTSHLRVTSEYCGALTQYLGDGVAG